jgi:hypothetical protein
MILNYRLADGEFPGRTGLTGEWRTATNLRTMIPGTRVRLHRVMAPGSGCPNLEKMKPPAKDRI